MSEPEPEPETEPETVIYMMERYGYPTDEILLEIFIEDIETLIVRRCKTVIPLCLANSAV